MRLVLLVDQVNIKKLRNEIKNKDVILTCNIDMYNGLKTEFRNQIFYENFYENASEIHEQFNNEFLSFYNDIKSEVKGNEYPLLLPFINGISKKTVNYINEVISSIKKYLSEYNIEKIVLFGGSPKVNYTSIFFAEGEVPARILYKKSWFLNYYINKLLKSTYIIKWIHKDSSIKLNFYKVIRRSATKYLRTALILRKIIKSKPYKGESLETIRALNFGKSKIVMLLARNPVQVKPLENIYNEISSKENTQGVFLTSSMLQKAVEFKLESHNQVNIDSLISLKELLGIFNESKKQYKVVKKFSKDKCICNIELIEVIQEIGSSYIEFLYRVYALEKFKGEVENISYIFTTETFNHNAAAEGLFAQVNNIPAYTIQHVTYPQKVYSKNNWTNGLVCMTNDIYHFFRKNDFRHNYYYFGPIAYDNIYNSSLCGEKFEVFTLTIFTQPDEYTKEYLEIIKKIFSIKLTKRINLKIKLHPREKNITFFEDIIKNILPNSNIKVEISFEDTNDLIRKSHLVASISSGTLFQALLSGTPTISLPTKFDKSKIDFLQESITHNIENVDRLIYLIEEYDDFSLAFFTKRTEFLDNKLDYKGNATYEMILNLTNM